jgi:hypothetical protein
MFGFLARKKPTPLADHLERLTPERAAAFLEKQLGKCEDNQDFLEYLLLVQIHACAGSFVGSVARPIARQLRASVDAVAVEGVGLFLLRRTRLSS